MEEQSFFDDDLGSSELGSSSGLWTLMQIPGIGSQTALKIAKAFSTWSQLAEDSRSILNSVGAKRVSEFALASMALNPLEPPEAPLGIQLVGYFDSEYPKLLRKISSPPAVLWVRGSSPTGLLAAVVGTRDPTAEGVKRVKRIVTILCENGFGIISGLASGIDTVAHETALEAGGITWAYLGSGVDAPTPKENLELADRIVEQGGGLLSEFDLSFEATPYSLVSRNRLQSGTSKLTVIGQSGIPSGTLHTARFALEQERSLVVISPPNRECGMDAWAGNEALIDRNGCAPEVLEATTKRQRTLVSERRPVADLVIHHSSQLNEFLTKFSPPEINIPIEEQGGFSAPIFSGEIGEEFKNVKAIVFDLDGTLANTNTLFSNPEFSRSPYEILKISRPGGDANRLKFGDGRELLPGKLAARGYRVGIVTNSPSAYASTLLSLLFIDYERLNASSNESKGRKLKEMAESWSMKPSELLYVSDRLEDKEKADLGEVEFLPARDIHKLERLKKFNTDTESSNDKEFNLQEAFVELRENPGSQRRRILQLQVLKGIKREHRECVLDSCLEEGRLQFPLWLVTKSEMLEDAEILESSRKAAASIFPFVFAGDVYSAVAYKSKYGEPVWQKLKDFKKKYDKNRPDVHQSLLFFLALSISGEFSKETAVIPISASRFSRSNPGELSLRLVHAMRELNPKVFIFPTLEENGLQEIENRSVFNSKFNEFVIVDDQFTFGNHMKKAKSDYLKWNGQGKYLKSGTVNENVRCFTWSKSEHVEKFSFPHLCILSGSQLRSKKNQCLCGKEVQGALRRTLEYRLGNHMKNKKCPHCFLHAPITDDNECASCGAPLG